MHYVIIGGFNNDHSEIMHLTEALSEIVNKKVYQFTLNEALTDRERLVSLSKNACVITHSSGIIAAMKSDIKPQTLLINCPPSTTNTFKIAKRVLARQLSSRKKVSSISFRELLFQINILRFNISNCQKLTNNISIIIAEKDKIFHLDEYEFAKEYDILTLPLKHGDIFSSSKQYLEQVLKEDSKKILGGAYRT